MHNFKKLLVWQKSVDLCIDVYKIIQRFPEIEKYALTVQISKSSVSIPSNIAEGSGRGSKLEFIQFLHIANGSACELSTQVLIAQRLGYINAEESIDIESKISEVQKMIFALKLKIQQE